MFYDEYLALSEKKTENEFNKVEQQHRMKSACYTESYITSSMSPNFISNYQPTVNEFAIY